MTKSPTPTTTRATLSSLCSMRPIVESGLKLVVLWWIIYPAAACMFSAIFAGPVAAAEDANYEDCFLFFLMAFTLTAIPLTPWVPTGTGGIVITLITAIFVTLLLRRALKQLTPQLVPVPGAQGA